MNCFVANIHSCPSLNNHNLINVSPTQKKEQAGAELGQAQLKLELDFTLIFFRFGFDRIDWLV